MKKLIQILILLLSFSCGKDQPMNEEVGGADPTEKEELKKSTEAEFTSDSSYTEHWCSLEVLKNTSESLNKLELSTIAKFLGSFHADCADDIEYSEWSNELLFEVANRSPGILLQLLHRNDSFDKELIKKEFESLIHDRIELDKLIDNIEKTSSPKAIKKEIIEALEIAKSKH